MRYVTKDPEAHLKRDCAGIDALGEPRRWMASQVRQKMLSTYSRALYSPKRDLLTRAATAEVLMASQIMMV